MMRAAVTMAAMLIAGAAQAENCSRSRDAIMTSSSGDLPQPAQTYLELYKNCLETLRLSNVDDAFILKGGAIAVVPKRDTVAATAATLAQFCRRFPRGRLHFVARRGVPPTADIAKAVQLTSSGSTPCQKIMGAG